MSSGYVEPVNPTRMGILDPQIPNSVVIGKHNSATLVVRRITIRYYGLATSLGDTDQFLSPLAPACTNQTVVGVLA